VEAFKEQFQDLDQRSFSNLFEFNDNLKKDQAVFEKKFRDDRALRAKIFQEDFVKSLR
jgi:hypothetical protein